MTYHPSNAQIGHFMGRETVYCNMNRPLPDPVYMFRWPPEVFNWVNDNALISGFGKVPIATWLRAWAALFSLPGSAMGR